MGQACSHSAVTTEYFLQDLAGMKSTDAQIHAVPMVMCASTLNSPSWIRQVISTFLIRQ